MYFPETGPRQELKEVGVYEIPHVAGSIMTTVSNILMITNGKREMKLSLSALRNTSVFSLGGTERESTSRISKPTFS
jgi:hypothetical protein